MDSQSGKDEIMNSFPSFFYLFRINIIRTIFHSNAKVFNM